MKKVKFGIPGLDSALEGGVEEGSAMLISGGPGTGKTCMGLAFVYHGAINNEPGIYLCLEEKKKKIIRSAQVLGMGRFESLVKSGRILLVDSQDFKGDHEGRIAETIIDMVRKNKSKRIVVDTLTTLSLYATSPRWKVAATHPAPKLVLFQPTKANVKQFVANFIGTINSIDEATMLFLSEDNDEYTPAQKYVCDSVIDMERPSLDSVQESEVLLRVIKTRRSSHSSAVHVVRIKSGRGVEVLPAAEALK